MGVSKAGGKLESGVLRPACMNFSKAKEEYYFKQCSKVSHQLRRNVVAEDLSSVPRTHQFTIDCNSIYRRSDSLLWSPLVPGIHNV